MAKIVELIYAEATAGNGQDDPFRPIQQLWTKDGRLVASRDYHTGSLVVTSAIGGLDRG